MLREKQIQKIIRRELDNIRGAIFNLNYFGYQYAQIMDAPQEFFEFEKEIVPELVDIVEKLDELTANNLFVPTDPTDKKDLTLADHLDGINNEPTFQEPR